MTVAASPLRPESRGWFRPALGFVIIVVVLIGLWEGYKLLGASTGGTIPFTATDLPVRADDRSMPHVWDIFSSIFEPARRGSDQSLGAVLTKASLITFREALAGFVVGSLIGLGLGLLFVRTPLAERGLLPWVIASQTIPLLAIAPMVVLWAGRYRLPQWVPVALISASSLLFPGGGQHDPRVCAHPAPPPRSCSDRSPLIPAKSSASFVFPLPSPTSSPL